MDSTNKQVLSIVAGFIAVKVAKNVLSIATTSVIALRARCAIAKSYKEAQQ